MKRSTITMIIILSLNVFLSLFCSAHAPWQQIGHANNVVAMAAVNGKLFAATKDNKLWMRTSPGVVTVKIRYKDVDGESKIGKTQISVIETAEGCEYRLEYNPADPTNWPIDEIAGDQGPPQRHTSSTCTVPEFTVTEATSKRQFEEQTVYYWTKRARDYAKTYLWITPPGWTGGPIKHANDRLGPNVLTQGAFSRACFPNPKTGCMRAWPHEGPKIHFKAGGVTAPLVAHEFGHYAAGFVFGHMDIIPVPPGLRIGYDVTDCAQRSFQETIAEMFMSLFLHHARYHYYAAKNPVKNGVPRSSFNLSSTDTWDGQCGTGGDDYVMGRPLVQAFHKTLWDNVWSSQTNANQSMANAFSYALAMNRGHKIDDLAYAILRWLDENTNAEVSSSAWKIFAAHGLRPMQSISIVELDFKPLYPNPPGLEPLDYALKCYHRDLQYPDVKLFKPVVRLAAPAPVGFTLRFYIQEEGSLSDPTIGIFEVRFDAGKTEFTSIKTPNVKSTAESWLKMQINRMPSGAPPEETNGFWLGCTKRCVIRGNGPKGNNGPTQNVYLSLSTSIVSDGPIVLTGLRRSPSHLVFWQ